MLKTCVILNPRSGRVAAFRPAVEAFAAARNWPVWPTNRPGHARGLAAEACTQGFDRVVAFGGDGTMNEVAGALVGTDVILGLIACGSGNGLARHLGIHGSLGHMLGVLARGEPRRIDTGTADGHPFCCVAGLGLEAEIARRFNALPRGRFHLLRYLVTGARTIRDCSPIDVTVEGDQGTFRLSALTLAVANADQYGNNARIAPGASVTDGLLDLTALGRPGPLALPPLVWRLLRGTLAPSAGVHRLRGRGFVVHLPAPGTLHTDGETHAVGRSVDFLVRPASLAVWCPPFSSPGP